MKRIISVLRVRLRKYTFIFSFLKSIHIIYIRIKQFPLYMKKVTGDKKKVAALIGEKRDRCWFVNVPSHANLGDQAMTLASRKWIRENYPERELVEITRESVTCRMPDVVSLMKKAMGENDIIFIQGGYTSCDRSPNETAHRIRAKTFLKNRIVFFPQTVFYTSEKQRDITAGIYNAHGNILFLARDEVSFNTVKDAFGGIDVLLYPDVVSSLIGRTDFERAAEKKNILLVIREDSEKKYSTDEINRLKEKLSAKFTVENGDLMISKNNQTPEEYKKIIFGMFSKMSGYELIITDRFHGILFSVISGTKAIAIDSIDHRVREGAFMFGGMYTGSVTYAETVDAAIEKANALYGSGEPVCGTKCYDEYYGNLKNLIERA